MVLEGDGLGVGAAGNPENWVEGLDFFQTLDWWGEGKVEIYYFINKNMLD